MLTSPVSRREFCIAAAGSVATLIAACRQSAADQPGPSGNEPSRLQTRPTPATVPTKPGTYRLRLGSDERDGYLYVPPSYTPSSAAPLLILLHGAGQASSEWSKAPIESVLDAHGVIALVPDSRGVTWDLGRGGYGPDVRFLDRALTFTYARCNIDPLRVGLGGFSDGASYALSLGITNGDLFSGLIALSPGFLSPAANRERPPIFVAHGTSDRILPIDRASRIIVPRLQAAGYDVTYSEFDGPHAIVLPVFAQAIEWFVAKKRTTRGAMRRDSTSD